MHIKTNILIILDQDINSIEIYKNNFNHYDLKIYNSIQELQLDMSALTEYQTCLAIIDPSSFREVLFEKFQAEEFRKLNCFGYIVTSQIEEKDFISFYLKLGALDFFIKPLRTAEVVAKVDHAIHCLKKMETEASSLKIDGKIISSLTFKEYQLLNILAAEPLTPKSRQDVFTSLWGNTSVSPKTLDVHLFNLRRKIRPYSYDISCVRGNLLLTTSKKENPTSLTDDRITCV